jgi:hypothetical protein
MDNSPVLVVTALGDVTADLVLDELYGRVSRLYGSIRASTSRTPPT